MGQISLVIIYMSLNYDIYDEYLTDDLDNFDDSNFDEFVKHRYPKMEKEEVI